MFQIQPQLSFNSSLGDTLTSFGSTNPSNIGGIINPSNNFNLAATGANGVANTNFGLSLQDLGIAPVGLDNPNLNPSFKPSNFSSGLNFDNIFKAGKLGLGLASVLQSFGQLSAIKQNNKFNQDLASTQLLSNATLTQKQLNDQNATRKRRDARNNTHTAAAAPTDILSGIQAFTNSHG